ncbi:MAG TPA: hypothetical protein VFE24_07710 [Pirellulales bacterium]|jgi:hypothetical protein|nr:hypothetical protein [Pirellulales bacterium]
MNANLAPAVRTANLLAAARWNAFRQTARLAFCALCGACLLGAAPNPSGENVKQPWPAKTDRPAILKQLQDISYAGFNRRLGPDYAAYHKDKKEEQFPEVFLAPVKQDKGGRHYEIGGPWTKKAGDFSSTQGQVLYVPENGNIPIDRVTILEWTNGTFSEAPEPPWHGGFRPEPTAKKWPSEAASGKPGMPIAAARGMGGWANCGLILFSSGFVATAGTVTAHGTDPVFQFPPHKLLTGVSITNRNEFAIVTLTDTETHHGQIAVLALESSGKKNGFAHEWADEHPWSLPNVAVFTDIKLLGYVDLPGIEFPTGVCAVGNHLTNRMNGRDGNAGLLREYDLSKQADRDVFMKGANSRFGSTAGYAVVIGKYENKAAFIDLQPLLQKVREMTFGDEASFQKTRDSGPGPKQWPYTFDADPSWKPVVVKVLDVPQPTAVLATLTGGEKARTFIASLDGKIGGYAVGGLATESPANPQEIVRLGEVTVGRNPTCLAYQKFSSDTFIACSRGDREIAWVHYTDKTAEVSKRLRDARLLDPVYLEVADTHGVETSLFTVADFQGKKILNYRWSQVKFATQGGAKFGMGPDGKDEFECGGIMEFPGWPFAISATNVN